MGTTLCIVDVQPRFDAAEGIVLDVIKEIKLARKRKAGIVLVEYDGYGDDISYEEVYKALDKYPFYDVVTKGTDNGGPEVIDIMQAQSYYDFNRIRICGCNACYCVRDTAMHLRDSDLFSRIEIAAFATNCHHHNGTYDSDECIDRLKRNIAK